MFVKVRRVFTLLSVLFLLFLFILPSLYLKDRCAELDELCGQVLFAARSGDAVSAQRTYVVLRTRYEQMRRKAELFLNHGVMDDATVPLHEMDVYLKTGDTLLWRRRRSGFGWPSTACWPSRPEIYGCFCNFFATVL